MNKSDPRFISAEKKIFDAAFELLPDKDIESIRTQDIISRAGIHKSTFYSHYSDKYALIEVIENTTAEMLDPILERILTNLIGESGDPAELRKAYSDLAACIFENKSNFVIILKNSKVSTITTRIASDMEKIWEKHSISDFSNIEHYYFINAAAAVMMGTIEKWLQRDCIEPIDRFVRLIEAAGAGLENAYKLL